MKFICLPLPPTGAARHRFLSASETGVVQVLYKYCPDCPIIVHTLSIICLNVQDVGGPWAMGQGLIKRVGQRLDKTKIVGCWTKGSQTVDFKGSRVCPNFVQLQGD